MNLLHFGKNHETAREPLVSPRAWERVRSAASSLGQVILGPPLTPAQMERRQEFIARYEAVIAQDDERTGYAPEHSDTQERDAA